MTRLLAEHSEQISQLKIQYSNYEKQHRMFREEKSRLDAEYHGQQSRLAASEDSGSHWSTQRENLNPASNDVFMREIHHTSLFKLLQEQMLAKLN